MAESSPNERIAGGREAFAREGALLVVDKPSGPTSHDVVDAIRLALSQRRVGHTGTLDPFATGVLVLAIGNATRLVEYLTSHVKRYRATLRLGAATDTCDKDGKVIAEREVDVDRAAIEAVLATFRGESLQTPPAYSARRIGGTRAHLLARRGEPVALAARPVRIDHLEIVACEDRDLVIDVEGSAGLYVRALARDLGERLGCLAHLRALRRIRCGPFGLEDATPLAQLTAAPEHAASRLLPPSRGLAAMPRIEVDAEGEKRVRAGLAVVPRDAPETGTLCRIESADGRLIAIGVTAAGTPDGALTARIRPRKVLS
jgi:tRNA pseudouridine55 synthase